jgi:hypothetical protein
LIKPAQQVDLSSVVAGGVGIGNGGGAGDGINSHSLRSGGKPEELVGLTIENLAAAAARPGGGRLAGVRGRAAGNDVSKSAIAGDTDLKNAIEVDVVCGAFRIKPADKHGANKTGNHCQRAGIGRARRSWGDTRGTLGRVDNHGDQAARKRGRTDQISAQP